MRILVFILFLSGSLLSYAGGDTLSTSRKSFLKNKRAESLLMIEKMNDDQLMLLIDNMFEANYIPPDLWDKIMLETAKRNISKINKQWLDLALSSARKYGVLHIDKFIPDSIPAVNNTNMMYLQPAINYYNIWTEDDNGLFKDQFTLDATHTLELENSEYGCFNMPAWGPLSSEFGWRNNRYHKGVDIQLRKSDTITCAFDGMVRFAQKKGGYGNVVIVRHYNGLETVYAHLYKIKVQEGQIVSSGELIGLAGNTGHSTGTHLHFEIRFKGAPVNPQYFISFDYGTLLYNTIVFKKNRSGLLAAFHPNTEYHTVERGETFVEIASRYHTTTTRLRSLNGMTPKQYVRLKAGQLLRVRRVNHSESASSKR